MAEHPTHAHPTQGAPADAGPPHAHSAVPYLAVWAALLVFTALTFFTGRMHLGAWALPLALGIATVKSVLVALFFMHLWEQRGANRLVFATSAVFLLLLVAITLIDVSSRFSLATPRGAPFGSTLDISRAGQGGPAANPTGQPAHDGQHPGFRAPSEGGLKNYSEHNAQDPRRP